ncbi:hypothetical protein [Actinacidiphila glaucinigra]|uniref:hypothetical protein n=1 Tax=Actinacidiphila glaucinigra TaxID=235986 RepID=UPI0035DD49CC
MNSNDPTAPLRDVAQNPEAYARYLADIQRVLLDIGKNLETLHHETRVHCRSVHVEGDRFYDARLRALPVERSLKDVLKHVRGLTEGLEKSAYKRRSHDDTVNALPKKRREKALAKERKKNPPLQPAPESPSGGSTEANSRYAGPTSVYDLGRGKSA